MTKSRADHLKKKPTKKTAKVKAVTVSPAATKVEPHSWTDGGEHVLILKRVGPDNRTHSDFLWPTEIGETVECPDWNPEPKCGGGLHGWAWGMALGEGMDFDVINDVFLVLAAKPEDVVGNLEKSWKVKAKTVTIVERGSFGKCWDKIAAGRDRLIQAMSKDQTVKDIASGDSSKAASSGNSSTAASSGNSSTAASSGNSSKAASSGDYSKAASSGNSSTAASSGNSSTAASSGNSSTAASSGNYSKAEQRGKAGIAASIGAGGYASAGDDGAIVACFWDGNRYRVCVGYVGEDGIEADTKYKADRTTKKLIKA